MEHRSANLVVLTARDAVRVSCTAGSASEALRVQRLAGALPPLPFAVPREVAPAIDNRATTGVVAIAQERLDGDLHPSGGGDPRELRRLLNALRETDLAPLRQHLVHRHAFFGGADSLSIMSADAIPMLAQAARESARRAADASVGLAPR